MSHPLVSIIVPSYNVERYIEECIESLLNQTYTHTEIIVIDDGSKDATVYLLKQYKDKIKVIAHDNNKGQGARRNEGIKEAKGKYLYFVDSDDWIEPDTIEESVKQLEQTDADLVRFNGRSFHDGNAGPESEGDYTFSHQLEDRKVYQQEEALQKNRKTFSASPCLYLVKKELIVTHNLYFLEGVLHEDEYFTTRLFTVLETMTYLNKAFYHRRYRAASTMTENTRIHKVKSFDSYLEVFKGLEEVYRSPELSENQKVFVKRQLLSIYHGLMKAQTYNLNNKKIDPSGMITLKDKVFLTAARLKQLLN